MEINFLKDECGNMLSATKRHWLSIHGLIEINIDWLRRGVLANSLHEMSRHANSTLNLVLNKKIK